MWTYNNHCRLHLGNMNVQSRSIACSQYTEQRLIHVFIQLTSCFIPWIRTYQLMTGLWKPSVVIGLLIRSWISTSTPCITFEFKHEMQKEWGPSLIPSSSGLSKVWVMPYIAFLFPWDCCEIILEAVLGTVLHHLCWHYDFSGHSK